MIPYILGLCPELTDPINGKVIVSGLIEGDHANYSCDTDYEILGSPTTVCLPTGLWDPAPPICYSKQLQCLYFFFFLKYIFAILLMYMYVQVSLYC